MTNAEYLILRAKEFGVTPIKWLEPHVLAHDLDAATSYQYKVDRFVDDMLEHYKKINKKDKELEQAVYQLKAKMPAVREQAEEAKLEIQRKKESVELADCLSRFDAMNIAHDDPLRQVTFTFQHHLDLARPFLLDLYEGECDPNKVITDPNYLEQLIIDDPDAVYLRGFLFMVAAGAYEQVTQTEDVLTFITNNPQVPPEEVKVLLVMQADVDNNTYVKKRYAKYVEVLRELREDGDLIDERSNGHHMNYFMLPSVNLHARLIAHYGKDKTGEYYTEEEARSYLTSLKCCPMLEHEFGYKSLLRLTDAFVSFQERTGKVVFSPLTYLEPTVLEDYQRNTQLIEL